MPHLSQPSRRSRARTLLASGVASAALIMSLVPSSGEPAAAATVGVLCSGFGPCTDAGMSAKGYHAVWDTMFWGMYAGKNCTNYVAYRMIQAGMSSTRPAQLKAGKGNASYWGSSFGSLTNQTPTVGSVAWWNANVPGAGSGGHVAYVEAVNSPTDITVSESNWSGNFDWRRITTAANWPSGFIHLHDAATPPPAPAPTPTPTPKPTPTPVPTPTSTAPVNTGAPTISGTVAVGQTISATPGTWSQSGLTFAYQWYADGVALSAGTASSYDIGKSKLGMHLSVKVTATGPGGSTSVTSAQTAPVIAGTIGVTEPPQITGDARIGATVTAVPPVTTKELTATSVQWYADGQPVPGAVTWSLKLDTAEVAHQLTVQVHGTREAFNPLDVASSPVGPVQAPPLQVTRAGSVSGTPQVGSVLTADPGTTAPAAVPTYTWLRDGQPIPGATAATYVPTTDDVTHHLAVRIALAASGYYPMSHDLPLAEPITAPVRLKVHAAGRAHGATAVVKVKSLGELIRGGTLTAKVGKHHVVAKVHGKALVLHLTGLAAGRRTLTLTYSGTSHYATAVEKQSVQVQR